MTPHVGLERGRSDERRLTNIAFEWSIPCVASNVVTQVAMRRERHPADFAFIRLDTVVDA